MKLQIFSSSKKSTKAPLLTKCLLVLAGFGTAFVPAIASAASPVENQTVFYYLVDMQRRTGKGCDGSSAQATSSLVPSTQLQDIVNTQVNTNKPVSEILQERGFAPSHYFTATLFGNTPQEAVSQMKENFCPQMMNGALVNIGAVQKGNQWIVVMTGDQTVQQPVAQALGQPQPATSVTGNNELPNASGTPQTRQQTVAASGYSSTESLPAESQVTGVYSEKHGMQTAPRTTPKQGNHASPGKVGLPEARQVAPNAAGTPQDPANPYFRQGQDPIIAKSATESLPAEPVTSGVYDMGTGRVKPVQPQGLPLAPVTEAEPLDPQTQKELSNMSPTEHLPAEPQVTGTVSGW